MVQMAKLVRRAVDIWSEVEKPTWHAMGGFLVGLSFSGALVTYDALRQIVLAAGTSVLSALPDHVAKETATVIFLPWMLAAIVVVWAVAGLHRRFPVEGRDLGRWVMFAVGIATGCLAMAASVW